MTKYLCVDPSHRRRGDVVPVDVSAQVRDERALIPRPVAYLAISEDVIAAVASLDEGPHDVRATQVARVVTGVDEPQDMPVILMARGSIEREPGRYEVADLGRTEPSIDQLLRGVGATSVDVAAGDEVVVIHGDPPDLPARPSELGSTSLLTRQPRRTRVIPQGVFRATELIANLATSSKDEAALFDAVRSTPVWDTRSAADPWRVVVTCPKAEGTPPVTHDAMFTGAAEPEAAVAYGTPVDAWDVATEDSARLDMSPATEVARVERRVWFLILAEVAVTIGMLVAGWMSGALGFVAREAAAWFGLSLVLAVAAVAFGALPLFSVRDPAANMNDTFVLRALYESRIIMLRWAAAISAVAFGLALMAAVIPPLLVEQSSIPSASVSFTSSTSSVTATMRVVATDIRSERSVAVTMREFAAGDQVGTLVGHVTQNGTSSGSVAIDETFALDPSAAFVSVLVTTDRRPADVACEPGTVGSPGCTVLAVPPPATQPIPQAVTNIVIPRAFAPSSPTVTAPAA
jgi:hypothetical protein